MSEGAPAVSNPEVQPADLPTEAPVANGNAPVANAPPADAGVTSTSSTAPAGGNVSLYVGELDPAVTEAMLYEIFSMVGTVASIRVCRDAVTRRSLGYAYINYINTSDGERALDSLNYSLIKGKPCRIMWSQRDPALRKTSAGNIFLKNLDETIDNKALHDTFAAFGNILSCKVALDEHGNSKGYGFVHFDTGEAADAAIAAVNGMLLNDKVVFVGHHIPKRERQAKIDEIRSKFTNLYVKGFSPETSDQDLEDLFKPFGAITSAVTQRDEENPAKSKGFGFVNFEDHDAAAAALDALNDQDHKGNTLIVTRAQKKGEREEELRKSYEQQKQDKLLKFQGVNLYVKNLDDDIDDEKLQAEFAPYGNITSCTVMLDEKGASKGFGFVCFSAPDEATKAVTELNGKMIGTKPLYVSLAQRKDQRKQQLEAQIAQRNQLRVPGPNAQMNASGIPLMQGYQMPPGMPNVYGYGYNNRGSVAPYGQVPLNNMPRGRYPPAMPGMPGMPMPGMPGMPYPQSGYPNPYGAYQRQVPAPGGRGYPNNPAPPQPNRNMPPNAAGPMTMPNQPKPPTVSKPPTAAPGNFKINANTRNAPPQALSDSNSITAAALAKAGPNEQKQILGEALYPRITETQSELAGKITGMLLEMDNGELLHLLENEDALNAKVSEAVMVLEEYNKTGTDA